MVVKKSVKKKVEKKKKVVKRPVKKSPVKKKVVKKALKHPLEPASWKELIEEEKVYKWINVVFHSLAWAVEQNVEAATNLGGIPVSVEQYKKNKKMFDSMFLSENSDGLELEKEGNVCKFHTNEDGTYNKVVLYEFSKSVLDARDKEYTDMLKNLEGLEADWRFNSLRPFGNDGNISMGLINKYSDGSFVNPSLQKHIEEFDKLIGPVEDPAELAALMKDKNREEWEKRKEAYLDSKIDAHEIDYLGEHSTFKKVADKYLDKEQKEIADLMGMSRFRYLLGWIEDILENVDAYGFYARGRVTVEGYDSFE